MHPKWTSVISLDDAKRLIFSKEKKFEDELAELDREIKAVSAANDDYERLLGDFDQQHQQRIKAQRSQATQTYIERSRELYFQTNYMQIYQTFGTQSFLWQMLQDKLCQFPTFITLLEHYEVEVSRNYAGPTNVALTLSLTASEQPRGLRTTFQMKDRPQLSLDELIKERRTELFEFSDNKSFKREMKGQRLGTNEPELFAIAELKEYSKSQDDNFLSKLLKENPNKTVHRKVFHLLEKWNENQRREVWPKLIGNRLKITPELYFNLRTISSHNFPKSIERVIVEDLKRVLRYYLKFWDLSALSDCYCGNSKATPNDGKHFEHFLSLKNERGDLLERPSEKELKESQILAQSDLDDSIWDSIEKFKIFQNLKEILMCFQVFRGDIGYVQGMCRLSFMTYSVFKNNIETFANFCNLIFFKKPLLSFYRFELSAIDKYEHCLEDFLSRHFQKLIKFLKSQNDKILKIFIMENFFILFANYFEEADNKFAQ